MKYCITVLPEGLHMEATEGEKLLSVLRRSGLVVDAPCGGNGTCGKCKVSVDGQQALACQTVIHQDMTVTLSAAQEANILRDGIARTESHSGGYALAFDIGTTTVAGYLLAPGGEELAQDSAMNPQVAFGADVISRIRHALDGQMEALKHSIRRCANKIALELCQRCGISPDRIEIISLVGNPAMQQLFLGISPDNLARLPFAPVLTQADTAEAAAYFPHFPHARLLIVPNISGFVGADTLACVLATGIHAQEALTLLVDIGTNGEMVLGNTHRMVACSTAAGPALEGANIQFGMRGQTGAIDHVWLENGQTQCSVIGGGGAVGICGSGLIDAVAAALDQGLLNERGRILSDDRLLHLADAIFLTQDDIRQLQLAKGAIAAGIELMAAQLGVTLQDIEKVYLAGAFGTYMDPASACRIGLLPAALETKITAVGNAAGSGAKILACQAQALGLTQTLAREVAYIELASVPEFQRCFAKHMRFDTTENHWCKKAVALGFSNAAPLDIATLQPRQDVRDMCRADKCGAYGKNWTCPPHCGTLTDCEEKMRGYRHGILLQTVGKMEKTVDTKAYRRTEAQHLRQFHELAKLLRKRYPNALCLGAGGCRVCAECAYPAPCRFPQEACSSMEGYGLFVTQVCRDNGCDYYHGEKTITYTACILF